MCDPRRRASLWSAENKDARPSSPCSKQQLQSVCLGSRRLVRSETVRGDRSPDLKGGGCLHFSPGPTAWRKEGSKGVRGTGRRA